MALPGMRTRASVIGRVLAYVTCAKERRPDREPDVEGPILEATGEFAGEASEACHNLSDCYGVVLPPCTGLLVFEGWIEWSGDSDGAEPEWMGQWRGLEFWELCKLRDGQRVFDDEPVAESATERNKR